MTDPQAAPPAAPAPGASMQMPGFLASMGRAELLMAAGAALIILTDLYSIFVAYGVASITWTASAVALLMLLMRARMPASVMANYRPILMLLGAIVVLIALRQVLVDIKFIATPPAGLSAERLIGMVGYYVGVGLIGFGAWQMWGRK